MSGFEIVGLLLATPTAIRQLIDFGKETHRAIKRIRHPESLPEDLKAFDLDAENRKLEIKIDIGKRICSSSHYDQKSRDALDSDFKAFQQALKDANGIVHELLGFGSFRQIVQEKRYVAKLSEAVTVLGSRRRQFMDTIDLIHIKETLKSFAELDAKHFSVDLDPVRELTKTIKVFRCHLTVEIRHIQPQHGNFVLELREYTDDTKADEERRAKDAAETLSTGRDNDHILDCVGYCNLASLKSLAIVFALPPDTPTLEPLGDYVRAVPSQVPSLTTRVKLCKQVAAAVLQVHTLQPPMVHKNINPDNIVLLFPEGGSSKDVPENPVLFLVNWQLSRAASEATKGGRVTQMRHKVYQHPLRQIPRRESTYTLDHDIYSLGVCMIEILLWQPLIDLDAPKDPTGKGLIVGQTNDGQSIPDDPIKWSNIEPEVFVGRLRHLVAVELPPVAGQSLASLISKCLDGLKEPTDELGAVFASVIKEPLDRIHV